MSNELISQTTEAALVKTVSDKTKAVRFGFMTRKAYGVANNMKGAALKRAHDAYRFMASRAAGGDLCKAISEGKAFITSIRHGEKNAGGSIHYVRDLKTVHSSKEQELRDIISALEKKLDAVTPAAAPAAA